MSHVVLLGDSIFDNAAYVRGGPDVIRQVREVLPAGWKATLAAMDGAVTASVPRQLQGLPPDASHLIISFGGNDALGNIGVLDDASRSIADALNRLAGIATASSVAIGRCWTPCSPGRCRPRSARSTIR